MTKINVNTDKLIQERIKQGLTAVALSKMIGVSKQAIYNIESELNRPSPNVAKAISDVLNIPFDELFEITKEGE